MPKQGRNAPRPDRPPVVSARRREIYLQASRLFVEKGYEATSMSDIAAAVKITKAGLYHFVEGKEDLLFTIVNFGMDELYDEVVEPARLVADPLERLKLIIRNHLANIGRLTTDRGNPVTIVVDETAGLSADNRRRINARKRGYFELVQETLAQLRLRGDAPKHLDPTVATHCLIGMIMWSARWRRPEGHITVDQMVEQITALFLHGIATPPVEDAAP